MTRPFRIAYVINSMEGGGAQSPLPAIVEAIAAADAEVQVFALARKDGRAIAALEEIGVTPQIFPGGLGDHAGAYRWAARQIADFAPDAIWTSLTRATLIGQVIGERMGVPVASWQHSAFLKPWNARLLRWRRKASDIWIADSSAVAAVMRDTLKITPERMVTWPIFCASPEAPQAPPWQEGMTVEAAAMGRLHVSKGYDVLIDALALLKTAGLPPFRVTIGGSGPDEAALRDRAQRAGVDNVRLAGFIEEPREFLALHHLYLQPSRREGFCIAMHEAMQAGLPVIVSRTGEMPYTVEDPAMGRIVPVENAAALAEAIADLLRDPSRLAAMGKTARARVLDRFSKDRFEASAATIVERLRAAARP